MSNTLDKIIRNLNHFQDYGVEIGRKRFIGGERMGRPSRTLAEALQQCAFVGFKPNVVIDVGVATGTFELYETFPQAFHLLVEPLEEFKQNLINICSKYRGDYVIAAAGATSGQATIHVHKDLLGSSLKQEVEGSYADGESREIPVTPLDEICSEKELSGPYLIKIDTQGTELSVLDGASKILEDTEFVVLEVSLFKFQVDGHDFYDVVSYMKQHGFVVYDLFGGHTRPLDGALAQIDVAFVKEDGLFRKNNSWATKEQRQKLNML